MHTLDVGCGARPKGSVNIDLYPGRPTTDFGPWDPRTITNFVQADAHHLPFREDSFSIVYSSSCFEHLTDPLRALRECRRVARKFVRIWVPSEYSHHLTPNHLYSWNILTLGNLMDQVFRESDVQFTGKINVIKGHKLGRLKFLLNLILSKFGCYRELCATARIQGSGPENQS